MICIEPQSKRCHDPFRPKERDAIAEPFPAGAPDASDGCVSRDLDPADWSEFRSLAHAMLDDMITHIETIRERPVWQPAPAATRERRAVLASLGARSSPGAGPSQEPHHPLRHRQSAPRLHGLGPWVRHAGRHDRRDGHRRLEHELRRAQSHRPRGRKADNAMDGRGPRLSRRRMGVFVTGSSMANFAALIVARTEAAG